MLDIFYVQQENRCGGMEYRMTEDEIRKLGRDQVKNDLVDHISNLDFI